MSEQYLTISIVGYNTLALSHNITGKLPATIPDNPIPLPPPGIAVPKDVKLITRVTFTLSDPSQNHRLSSLQSSYDLLALRPTTEKAFQLCCHSLDCDIISLDLSTRLPFILKFKALSTAIGRGVRFEICYSAGITGGGTDARRNLIAGATSLIRASRGRGLIISSEAKAAVGLRGPWDVVNLCAIWGLGQERGKEGVCEEARKIVTIARIKRNSYRGVVEIQNGGQNDIELQPTIATPAAGNGLKTTTGTKRKAAVETPNKTPSINKPTAPSDQPPKQLSKKEMKRQAKRAKIAQAQPAG